MMWPMCHKTQNLLHDIRNRLDLGTLDVFLVHLLDPEPYTVNPKPPQNPEILNPRP